MPNKSTLIKVIATIIIIAVLGGAYYVATNYQNLFGKKTAEQAGQGAVTMEEIQSDFSNRERKSASGVTPPQVILDRFNGQIAASQKAIADNKPSDASSTDLSWDYGAIANSQAILGQYDVAEQSYLKALAVFPDNYRANMNLGDLYILMDLPQSAAIKFNDTIALYPTDALVCSKLADLYYKYSKVPEKADSLFENCWKNATDKRQALDAYIVYLEASKKDPAKLAEMKKEYEKIIGSAAEQQKLQIEQAIDAQ